MIVKNILFLIILVGGFFNTNFQFVEQIANPAEPVNGK